MLTVFYHLEIPKFDGFHANILKAIDQFIVFYTCFTYAQNTETNMFIPMSLLNLIFIHKLATITISSGINKKAGYLGA